MFDSSHFSSPRSLHLCALCIGEGYFNAARVMRALQRVGFTGFLLDDHGPFIVNDTDYGHRGRAHAIGDMQGLLDTLAREAT